MSERLTQEQVDALPDGTLVDITWSGGNGPHRYRIAADGPEPGRRYAVPPVHDPDNMLRYYNPISFVGTRPGHTAVSLAEGEHP